MAGPKDGWDGDTYSMTVDTTTGVQPTFKYNEDMIIKEILEYVTKTYGAHYDSDDGVQVMDLIFSEGDELSFCKWNGVKYLARYGKKEGFNRKDLLKAIHYCMFLLYSNGKKDL